MTQQQHDPYKRGLFVPLSGAEAEKPPSGAIVVNLGGTHYDMAPYLGAVNEMGSYIAQFGANPLDARSLLRLQAMSRRVAPGINAALRSPSPVIQQTVKPMAQGLSSFMKQSQQLVALRLKTSYRVARAPKILVPIPLQIAAGATTAGIQVRNPYLGATGGNTGQYQSAWAISSFRTSNNESGQLSPIRLTDFTIGGHNFVAASLNGLTYSAGGAPATLGWSAAAFAETKRSHWATEIQPWNVIAQHGGGTGFGSVMTETGFFQIGVFNGGSATYVDTYSVYCNATLCGNPYLMRDYTEIDAFRKSFAPLNLQAPLALKLAGDADEWVSGSGIPLDDHSVPATNPYVVAARSHALLSGAVQGILDNPAALMTPTEFIDPRDAGFALDDNAFHVG